MTTGDQTPVRVMIVDDDERMRFLLRAVLEEIGCEVAGEAPGGAEAIDSLDNAAPDVVLVDYVMPGMDGIECAEALRAERPELAIIIFSSLFDRRLAGEVESRGLYYLEKARGLDGLEQAIDEIMQQPRPPQLPVESGEATGVEGQTPGESGTGMTAPSTGEPGSGTAPSRAIERRRRNH